MGSPGAPDELVFATGALNTPAYLVLSGSLKVARRDALGGLIPIITHEPGELAGEIGQLTGGPALAEGHAGEEGLEAMPFDSAQLRSLVIGSAEIGEAVMRAFILRRVFLIDVGAGTVLLGSADSAESLNLQNFLRRNAVPYTLLDPLTDPQATALIERLGIRSAELPLAICPDGKILVRGPSLEAGMSQYLVDRIHALPNVTVHTQTELTQLIGDATEGLQAVSWRDRTSAREEQHPIHHVFLFIGAVPSTDWLKGCEVKVDARGFVHTCGFACRDTVAGEVVDPVALWLETSLPGVFAIGDVRAGSVKRVSAAVGEGAGVVSQLHLRLQGLRALQGASEPTATGRTAETPRPSVVSAGA